MKLKKILGKRIQELRTKNGLKQSELAEKVCRLGETQQKLKMQEVGQAEQSHER